MTSLTRANYSTKGLRNTPSRVLRSRSYPSIQVSISTVSKYQYPRGGTYDSAHHVPGKTIQHGDCL
ncbi:unnamed protein product, partial [Prunus brigantina]